MLLAFLLGNNQVPLCGRVLASYYYCAESEISRKSFIILFSFVVASIFIINFIFPYPLI